MEKKLLTVSELLSFDGKRVAITGASSGIGKATAIRFAEAGAHLLAIDRGNDTETPEHLRQAKGYAHYSVDLAKKESIDAFWNDLSDDELPDILINNAGVYPMKEFQQVDEAFLSMVMEVNLNSMFWMCQSFVARRKNKGGIIINTSSIEAIIPFTKDLIPYGMSKAGVVALTRAIAREYGAKGFRANVVMPGGIMTEGTHEKQRDVFLHLRLDMIKTGYDFQQRLANGIWGKPDDIAKVSLFLASDMASYIQGAIIPVDGGFLTS